MTHTYLTDMPIGNAPSKPARNCEKTNFAGSKVPEDLLGTLEHFICGLPIFHGTMEYILKACVVEMWGAFEVLAGDLLKKSKQFNTNCFGHLTGSEKKPKFYKREFIRESYRVTFDNDPRIEMELASRSIDELHIMRNLLVHNAGITDPDFEKQCSDAIKLPFSTTENTARLCEWAAIPKDSRILFDGRFVMSMIDPVIDVGWNLVESVGFWLQTHSPI